MKPKNRKHGRQPYTKECPVCGDSRRIVDHYDLPGVKGRKCMICFSDWMFDGQKVVITSWPVHRVPARLDAIRKNGMVRAK